MSRNPYLRFVCGLGVIACLDASPRSPTLELTAAALSQTAGQARRQVSSEVEAILREIQVRDAGQLAVSEEDGRFLRVMVAAGRAHRALEIGAASGYSAIWMGLGLRETGGRLVTIEYDPARAREAAANIQRAGLGDIVEVISGDAFKEIPKLAGTFDFVFLDAWKPDYKRFFDLVLPRLDPGSPGGW